MSPNAVDGSSQGHGRSTAPRRSNSPGSRWPERRGIGTQTRGEKTENWLVLESVFSSPFMVRTTHNDHNRIAHAHARYVYSGHNYAVAAATWALASLPSERTASVDSDSLDTRCWQVLTGSHGIVTGSHRFSRSPPPTTCEHSRSVSGWRWSQLQPSAHAHAAPADAGTPSVNDVRTDRERRAN